MKMENYAYVRVNFDNHKIMCLTHEYDNENNPEESNYYVSVMGNVYGRPGMKNGDLIHTSAIKNASDVQAETYSGSIYEFGKKDPDYIAYEEAVSKGLTILENWSIGNIGYEKGVYIKANVRNGDNKKFSKKIVAQDGPVLTFYDGTQAFVDWTAIQPLDLKYLAWGVSAGEVKGRTFCGVAFEPDILNSEWFFAATAAPMPEDLAKFLGII